MSIKYALRIVITVLFFTAGCANTNFSQSSISTSNSIGTRVALFESCPSGSRGERSPGLAVALAAAIAPKLIDHGIAWLHETIKAEAKRFDAMVESNTAGMFYTLTENGFAPNYECVAVARGALSAGDEAPSLETPYGKLGFAQEPDFFMESQLVYEVDQGSIYVRASPENLNYQRPLAGHGRCKDLVVTYTFGFPSVQSGSQDGISVSTVMPALELCAGTKLNKAALRSLSSPWIRVPGPSKEPEKADADGKKTTIPVNLMIRLIETDRGHGAALTLHLAQALQESAGDISKILSEKIKE